MAHPHCKSCDSELDAASSSATAPRSRGISRSHRSLLITESTAPSGPPWARQASRPQPHRRVPAQKMRAGGVRHARSRDGAALDGGGARQLQASDLRFPPHAAARRRAPPRLNKSLGVGLGEFRWALSVVWSLAHAAAARPAVRFRAAGRRGRGLAPLLDLFKHAAAPSPARPPTSAASSRSAARALGGEACLPYGTAASPAAGRAAAHGLWLLPGGERARRRRAAARLRRRGGGACSAACGSPTRRLPRLPPRRWRRRAADATLLVARACAPCRRRRGGARFRGGGARGAAQNTGDARRRRRPRLPRRRRRATPRQYDDGDAGAAALEATPPPPPRRRCALAVRLGEARGRGAARCGTGWPRRDEQGVGDF